MVFRFAADAQTPCLNAWKDDSDELAERGWVERDDTISTAALCILGVNTITGNGCFGGLADGFQPKSN